MMNDEEEDDFSPEQGIDLKEGEEGKALLVGVYEGASNLPLCLEHLEELRRLGDTFGIETVGQVTSSLRKIDASTYLHSGKLDEIALMIKEKKANCVLFDEEISPAQQRNLEKRWKVAVMDRTELILEIFAQRAQTKEAQLQVELARTKYQFPRLKRMWSHFSRQRASGGYLRGEGEKQIEIDRRLLNKKLDRLRAELKEVEHYRKTQRRQRVRSGIPTFAIVGYTNAGKSTLLNALTEAQVFVEDKLFATLDPTTRKFTLPNRQEVLLTDTVGFIRKLPHMLVAAFKSTLESALEDDILLHLIDVSHPLAEEQAETTHKILKELGAEKSVIITVLNKIDACTEPKRITRLRLRYPRTVQLSALKREGFDDLTEAMIREIAARREKVSLRIPQNEYALVTLLRREGLILSEEYEENDILLTAEVPIVLLHRINNYRLKDD